MDRAYEKLLKVIRSEAEKQSSPMLRLAEMKTANTCIVGSLLLEADDLLIAEHLVTGYHKAVDEVRPQSRTADTFVNPLKSGDIVVVYKIENKYVILEKVVTP